VGARFWEEIGNQPTSAVIVDRAVRLWMRDTDVNETLSEAEASVVREIMSKVDQAVEASSFLEEWEWARQGVIEEPSRA
jgi:hypothetical protein